MGSIFGRKLREWRDEKGISGNRLAKLAGVEQSLINGLELGRRPPSDTNLEAIAAVEEMGITLDRLKAWRVADKAGGVEGLRLLVEEAPELLALEDEPDILALEEGPKPGTIEFARAKARKVQIARERAASKHNDADDIAELDVAAGDGILTDDE